jgi:ribosomal protein L37AE/L43A
MKQFQSPPFNLCAQCGAAPIAPIWAEHLDERHVRNLWSCDSCGYQFETSVYFPVREFAEGQPQPPLTSALVH